MNAHPWARLSWLHSGARVPSGVRPGCRCTRSPAAKQRRSWPRRGIRAGAPSTHARYASSQPWPAPRAHAHALSTFPGGRRIIPASRFLAPANAANRVGERGESPARRRTPRWGRPGNSLPPARTGCVTGSWRARAGRGCGFCRWRGGYCRPGARPGFPGRMPNQDRVNSQHGGGEGERDAPGLPGAHVGPGRVPDVYGAMRPDCL